MRKVAILGSTGSIGTQALAAMRRHPDRFRVTALAAGSNAALLEEQARMFRPDAALLANSAPDYRPPDIPGVTWLLGEPASRAIAGSDTVLNAIVGAQGMEASCAAAQAGVRLCLANKETLVSGGTLFLDAVRKGGCELIPVDSEHSAIFQCVDGKKERPERLILTASGGPFRTWTKGQMRIAKPEQALRHPNWAMGERITIDSATMVNKALEIIEAGLLFGMGADSIDVLIHPSSIVHSMVRYRDGALLAQMGQADMRTPILYALSYPERLDTGLSAPDLTALGPLAFEPPDEDRFPALRLGYDVLRSGGVYGAVFNAADEVAVHGFLTGRCGFADIYDLCADALADATAVAHPTLEQVIRADQRARSFVARRLGLDNR